MDIDRVQAQWALGLVRPRQLPEFAAEAMRQGHRGRCLEELAELDPRLAMPEQTVEGALRETGREPITAMEAVRRLARHAALRILRDEIPPIEGAREILGLLRRFDRDEVPSPLREFRWEKERKRSLEDRHRIVELAWELLEDD